MGKSNKGSQYLARMAATMIAQLDVSNEEVTREGSIGSLPQFLWESRSGAVFSSVKRMNPSTIGTIIAQGLSRPEASAKGKTSYWDTCGLIGWEGSPGKNFLWITATRVIIAEMYDILRERLIERETGKSIQGDRAARQRANDVEEATVRSRYERHPYR